MDKFLETVFADSEQVANTNSKQLSYLKHVPFNGEDETYIDAFKELIQIHRIFSEGYIKLDKRLPSNLVAGIVDSADNFQRLRVRKAMGKKMTQKESILCTSFPYKFYGLEKNVQEFRTIMKRSFSDIPFLDEMNDDDLYSIIGEEKKIPYMVSTASAVHDKADLLSACLEYSKNIHLVCDVESSRISRKNEELMNCLGNSLVGPIKYLTLTNINRERIEVGDLFGAKANNLVNLDLSNLNNVTKIGKLFFAGFNPDLEEVFLMSSGMIKPIGSNPFKIYCNKNLKAVYYNRGGTSRIFLNSVKKSLSRYPDVKYVGI